MENLYTFFENISDMIEITPRQKYVKVSCYYYLSYYLRLYKFDKVTYKNDYSNERIIGFTMNNYSNEIQELSEYFQEHYNKRSISCLLIYNLKTETLTVHHNNPRQSFDSSYCFTLDKN